MLTSSSSSDHPIFKRFSRQQLVVRRRSIGFQTLCFETSLPKTPRCKHCGRTFNAVWREFLCHVCGLWVCQPCSSVVERERELNRIQYIRSCYDCLSMLNKWSDPELLTQFAISPWVIQSSKSQISLNLSDALRARKESRQTVLVLLKHLGMPVDPSAAIVDQISETAWNASTTQEMQLPHSPSDEGSQADLSIKVDTPSSSLLESAQHLVQQCFEVVIPEVPLEECVFAESNGTRHYPIFYDTEQETVGAPIVDGDAERELCIDHYNLLTRSINGDEMRLVCDLAAKEMDASTAFISVVRGDTQHTVASRPGCGCSSLQRSETFCAFGLMSPQPFLVRDAALDIRFRNFNVVRGSSHLMFYFGFPIVTDDGTTVASLCVVDTKPRTYVTTMQYSIMKKLAEIIMILWNEMLLVAQI